MPENCCGSNNLENEDQELCTYAQIRHCQAGLYLQKAKLLKWRCYEWLQADLCLDYARNRV